ncbi:Merlin [Frankliniella fusca]|uniref:Merlin n=1 Tax=Frankliniella fusca TaxID=407009 RepID=A0AAE1GY30_9NEOP|nr:Merlin [Frankliniella fusca]
MKSLNPCQTFHVVTINKPTKPSPLSDISNHVVKSVSSSSNLHQQNVSLSYSCIQPFQKVGDTTKNQKACTHSKNRLSLSNNHARDRNPSDGVIVRARDIAANLLCSSDSSSGKTSDPPRPSSPLTHPIPEVIPPDKTHDADCLSSDDTDLSDLSDAFEPEKNSHLENSRQHTAEQIKTTKRNRKVAGCRKSSDDIATIVEKARERSLSDPLFQKIHEKMPSLMADYVITEAELSENPVNPEDGEYWTATLRVNIDNKSDALEWLSNYENASSCDFRVTKCKKTNNSKRLVLKREYHCHHDTKPKEKSNNGPKKSKNWISKHTNCRSIIRFTIKQKSMAWSSDYLLKEYPCEIFIRHHHNHPVKCADAQRLRRPNQEVKEKFLKLFAQGHSPISAIETHKFDLMMEHGDNFNFILADGSRCPSNFWVYKLYKKVCVGHYGPQSGEGIIKTLRDYALKYNKEMGSECMKVEILNDNDLVVALCTPLMQRTHELLPSSGEMIYVDSSGNMDALNCRVFPVMTHSVAGALPLGIMIVSSESEEVLAVAVNILKSILPPKAFYGRGAAVGPKIAMTDDCPNERNAIRSAFPGIILLLCLFHVLQAFWRYLWNREHNVALKNRPELFYVLRDLAYAPDENTFNQRKEEALENPMLLSHTLVLNHIEKFLGRSKEWALFQRLDLLTRGNNTNNCSEATMKLIKDKVLGRTKAFNPVQLVDFLVTRFPAYIEMRISDVLNNRSMNTFKLRYFIRPEKLENLISEKLPSPPDCYKVSNTSKTTSYIVMMSEEICSCPEGKSGKPCKHLCKVVKDFNLSSSQLLPREQLGGKN